VDIKKSIKDTVSKLIIVTFLASNMLVFDSLSEGSGAKNKVGSESDDWWTAYPAQSSVAASEIEHPQWVIDALENKHVVIYVHKGCGYCRPQTEAMAEVVSKYGDKFVYYDISAGGSDSKAEDALRAYDPNGGVSYVPLTAIVTLAPDSKGLVRVIWHSTEEVTGKAWIEEYVQDAVSYHNDNSGNWKKSVAQRSVFHGSI
jgi:thiol-disulfide isomerase/thioredoxin